MWLFEFSEVRNVFLVAVVVIAVANIIITISGAMRRAKNAADNKNQEN